MTNNDTNTLNGALMELGSVMAENLTTQGVESSASDGLTTLAGKILDIQGGGGSLPNILSQIKGGSFTLGSDIQASNYPIPHELGEVPTGVIVWTEERLDGTPSNRYVQSFYISEADLSTNNYVAVASTTILNTNGASATLNATFTNANVGTVLTTEYFKYNNSAIYYKAGITYKWIALCKSTQPTPTPSDLPIEYQEVTYIENTSTSYIDTDYSMTSDVVEYSVKCYGRPPNSTSICGAERNANYNGVLWTNTTESTALYIGSKKEAIKEYLQNMMWHTITVKTTSATSGSFDIDGYERSFTYTNGILKGYPIYLFANNSGGATQNCKIRIARFKISDNGEQVRDLVPCYRKADGVIGMYDLVNDVFYTNSGTGTFTKGADI